MIKSMTGFGRGEYSDGKKSIMVEIRAVNNRYCDITVKMPRRYAFAEEHIKNEIKQRLSRGKIEVSLVIDSFGQLENDIVLNKDAAQKYYDALKNLSDEFELSGSGITLSILAGMPEVIKSVPRDEDESELLAEILAPTKVAVDDICRMRAVEGAKLAEDILGRADIIEDIKNKIAERAPEISGEYATRIKGRIDELLEGKIEIPEDRILLEAAVFADKSNITEEFVRLESHIEQLRALIASDASAIGKKIDFLIQEMNREANTIGSKSNDGEITSLMIDLKAEIEKVREQVQNIE